MSVTELEVVAPEISPEVKADPMALWPTREVFLDWCREHGIKGEPQHGRHCLVAHALAYVAKEVYVVTSVFYRAAVTGAPRLLPEHLRLVVADFDFLRLREFIESRAGQ